MTGLHWIWQDLCFGLRSLRKDLRFTGLAILTLGLGIAAATVIFSILDSAILHPFPFKDADRIVTMYVHDVTSPQTRDGSPVFTVPELMDFREQNHAFEDVYGNGTLDVLYNNGTETLLFSGVYLTPNGFEFLGVKPYLGRWPTEEDAKAGSPPVFAMSYRLWTSQFNQDPNILGAAMTLNGMPRTLVAVMPPRFLVVNGDIYLTVPWSRTDIPNPQQGGLPISLVMYERLKRDMTLKSAASDFDVLARREAILYPKNFPAQFTIRSKYMGQAVSGSFGQTLYLLLGATLLLLLIGCINVANLLLARATVREREIAIRVALGASRTRIVLQLLVESFLLAAAGCLLGCSIAYAAVKYIAGLIPPGWFAYEAVIAVKPIGLWFAAGLGALATVLSGLAPAMHAVSGSLAGRLTNAGKGLSSSFRHGKVRAALVIIEVALSIPMLVGAGLMMRTLVALQHVDLGLNPSNVLQARISLSEGRYGTAQQKRIFFQDLLQRLVATPGVIAASETSNLPPFIGYGGDVTIPGKPHTERWITGLELVSDGYFRTLGLRLLQGKTLSDVDINSARHVIVVNQTLVNKYFKGEDPIGKAIKFNMLDQLPDAPHDAYFEIVGIVQDTKNQGLRESPIPEAFVPYTITGGLFRGVLVRTTADPLLMVPNLHRIVSAIDSNVPLTFTGSLTGFLQQFQYAQPEFGLITMAAFAAIGLVLVIIGVFSVMAYTVSLQTHEIGIRMALGAQQADVMRMVLKKGLTLIFVGIIAGLLTSFTLIRLASSQFWGVSAADPWTLGAVVLTIAVVGLGACIFPARRAIRVDPMVALRYE